MKNLCEYSKKKKSVVHAIVSVIKYMYQVLIGTPRKEIVVKRRKAITSDCIKLNYQIKLSN